MNQIPMLDLKLEYEYIKEDIDTAIRKCLEHQQRMLLKHGGKDKYNVDHIGYNARLDTLQAAILQYLNEKGVNTMIYYPMPLHRCCRLCE